MGVLEEQQAADGRWRREVDTRLTEHQDTLSDFEARLNRGSDRFAHGEARMTEMEAKLDANTAMTGRVEANTKQLLQIFGAFAGFMTVSGWLGTFLKWTAAIVISVGVIVYVWKTGNVPTPK